MVEGALQRRPVGLGSLLPARDVVSGIAQRTGGVEQRAALHGQRRHAVGFVLIRGREVPRTRSRVAAHQPRLIENIGRGLEIGGDALQHVVIRQSRQVPFVLGTHHLVDVRQRSVEAEEFEMAVGAHEISLCQQVLLLTVGGVLQHVDVADGHVGHADRLPRIGHLRSLRRSVGVVAHGVDHRRTVALLAGLAALDAGHVAHVRKPLHREFLVVAREPLRIVRLDVEVGPVVDCVEIALEVGVLRENLLFVQSCVGRLVEIFVQARSAACGCCRQHRPAQYLVNICFMVCLRFWDQNDT